MKRVLIAAALLAVAAPPLAGQTRGRPTRYEQAVERQLIDLVEQWGRAARASDARALNRLLADEFTVTTADGRLKGKKEYVEDFASGSRRVTELSLDNYRVSLHGNTAAVTHGGTLRASEGGSEAGGRYRWTHIFVRRGTRWRCVATQATRLQQQ